MEAETEVDDGAASSESRQAMEIELEEGPLLSELRAVIPGGKVGETRAATVKFPDDYAEPRLAGKEATIKVTVQGVKEKVLPDLDDELVKQLSGGKHENVDAYRSSVREELEESAKALAQMAREQAVR